MGRTNNKGGVAKNLEKDQRWYGRMNGAGTGTGLGKKARTRVALRVALIRGEVGTSGIKMKEKKKKKERKKKEK